MSEEIDDLDAYASRRALQVTSLGLADLERVADVIGGILLVSADLSEFCHPDPLDFPHQIAICMGALRANVRLFEEREELGVALETWFAGMSQVSAREAASYGLVVDKLRPHGGMELESWHDAVLQHGRFASNWGNPEQGQFTMFDLQRLPRLKKRRLERLLKRELAAARRAAIAAGMNDKKDDTQKKDGKSQPKQKRRMNKAATWCAREYRRLAQAGEKTVMKEIIDDYVEKHGGSASYTRRILNDHPEEWKGDTKDDTETTT